MIYLIFIYLSYFLQYIPTTLQTLAFAFVHIYHKINLLDFIHFHAQFHFISFQVIFSDHLKYNISHIQHNLKFRETKF